LDLKTGQPLVIEDTLMNPNFLKNPLVTGYPFIRFYAGYPVRLPGGDIAGAICVLDSSPKSFPRANVFAHGPAAIVEDEFELLQIAIKDSLVMVPTY
jgi:GAF domain-containing protein